MMKKIYRIELLSDSGDSYVRMGRGSAEEINRGHGDTEGGKIIAGTHPQWKLTQVIDIPDKKG